jgi:hypothetical protein
LIRSDEIVDRLSLVAISVMLLAPAIGCRGESRMAKSADTSVALRLSVLKSGKILADGRAVSLQELDRLLAANAQRDGIVWYYREAGQDEPPPEAMEAIQLVVRYRRPISMSSKPDFSDVIDEKGTSHPRSN